MPVIGTVGTWLRNGNSRNEYRAAIIQVRAGVSRDGPVAMLHVGGARMILSLDDAYELCNLITDAADSAEAFCGGDSE